MTNVENLELIVNQLPEGVTPKITVLNNNTKYRKNSLFGIKSNGKGCTNKF